MDVFISYKSEDFNEANWVKTTLETNRISCWMAPMSIPGGSNYAMEIPQAIRSAKIFVLILSEKCQDSKWVPRELDQAIQEEKVILPFMLENCLLKDDFNFYLSNVQRYAAYENKSNAISRMINQIQGLLEIKESEQGIIIKKTIDDATNHDKLVPAQEQTEKQNKTDASGKETKVNEEDTDQEANTTDVSKERRTKSKDNNRNKHPNQKVRKHSIQKEYTPEKDIATASQKRKMAFVIIVTVIFIIGFAGVLGNMFFGSVHVADQKIKRSATYVSLSNKKLTEKDIHALQKIRDIGILKLEGCSFPDAELKTVLLRVRSEIELSNCELTNERIQALGLSKTSVDTLRLDNNENVTDLHLLSDLKKTLYYLSFSGCSVTDVSFLNQFTKLWYLDASDNGINDISALSECPRLEEVHVEGNSIASLKPLHACEKLEEIYVGDNMLTDLSGIETCIYLKTIDAQNNQLTDIEALKNATLLTFVDFSNNNISDFSALAPSAATLKEAVLSANEIKDTSFLRACIRLTKLRVDDNLLTSLDSLQDLAELQTLTASHNQLTDISGISNCTNLTYLDLSDNHITATDAIHFQSSDYINLDLSHNSICHLSIPKAKYRQLSLYGNPITDISSLYDVRGGSDVILDYSSHIDFAKLKESGWSDYIVFDCPLDRQVKIQNILGEENVRLTTEKDYKTEET